MEGQQQQPQRQIEHQVTPSSTVNTFSPAVAAGTLPMTHHATLQRSFLTPQPQQSQQLPQHQQEATARQREEHYLQYHFQTMHPLAARSKFLVRNVSTLQGKTVVFGAEYDLVRSPEDGKLWLASMLNPIKRLCVQPEWHVRRTGICRQWAMFGTPCPKGTGSRCSTCAPGCEGDGVVREQDVVDAEELFRVLIRRRWGNHLGGWRGWAPLGRVWGNPGVHGVARVEGNGPAGRLVDLNALQLPGEACVPQGLQMQNAFQLPGGKPQPNGVHANLGLRVPNRQHPPNGTGFPIANTFTQGRNNLQNGFQMPVGRVAQDGPQFRGVDGKQFPNNDSPRASDHTTVQQNAQATPNAPQEQPQDTPEYLKKNVFQYLTQAAGPQRYGQHVPNEQMLPTPAQDTDSPQDDRPVVLERNPEAARAYMEHVTRINNLREYRQYTLPGGVTQAMAQMPMNAFTASHLPAQQLQHGVGQANGNGDPSFLPNAVFGPPLPTPRNAQGPAQGYQTPYITPPDNTPANNSYGRSPLVPGSNGDQKTASSSSTAGPGQSNNNPSDKESRGSTMDHVPPNTQPSLLPAFGSTASPQLNGNVNANIIGINHRLTPTREGYLPNPTPVPSNATPEQAQTTRSSASEPDSATPPKPARKRKAPAGDDSDADYDPSTATSRAPPATKRGGTRGRGGAARKRKDRASASETSTPKAAPAKRSRRGSTSTPSSTKRGRGRGGERGNGRKVNGTSPLAPLAPTAATTTTANSPVVTAGATLAPPPLPTRVLDEYEMMVRGAEQQQQQQQQQQQRNEYNNQGIGVSLPGDREAEVASVLQAATTGMITAPPETPEDATHPFYERWMGSQSGGSPPGANGGVSAAAPPAPLADSGTAEETQLGLQLDGQTSFDLASALSVDRAFEADLDRALRENNWLAVAGAAAAEIAAAVEASDFASADARAPGSAPEGSAERGSGESSTTVEGGNLHGPSNPQVGVHHPEPAQVNSTLATLETYEPAASAADGMYGGVPGIQVHGPEFLTEEQFLAQLGEGLFPGNLFCEG